MEETLHPIAPNQTEAFSDESSLLQLQAQNQLLLTLLRTSAMLAAELESQDFAQTAVQTIVQTVPHVVKAALWFFDRVEKRLRLAAVHGVPHLPVLDADSRDQIALRLYEGHVGEAVATHLPRLLIAPRAFVEQLSTLDAENAAILSRLAAALPPNLRIACLPLYLGSLPIGALELFYTDSVASPTQEDLPLLQAFADQLAVVFHNAQMYAEMSAQHRRLQAFDAVVTAITNASDIQQMLEQALSVTLYVVGAERGMILLNDDGLAEVAVSYQISSQAFATGAHFPVEGSPCAEVIRSGQPSVQPLRPLHPWAALLPADIEAVALLPLLSGGTVVGVLVIGLIANSDARLDWASLLAIGNQIGIAVANHQLYNASQRERRQLAGVIASIAEGVIICDRLGHLVLSNYAAETLLGQPLEAGMPLAELSRLLVMQTLDGQEIGPEDTPFARCLRGDVYQNYEASISVGADVQLFISCSGAPLLADDGSIDGAVVVIRDITAYKRHDAVRDQFVAVAAHELRAPLAAVKGYTDLLVRRTLQDPNGSDRDRKGIMMLSRQIEHLVQLVDNLLNVSRLDSGQLELHLQRVDLVSLIEASIERIRLGDANHEFEFNGPPRLDIICDQLRVQQVFTNLLANAARYSAAGTRVVVELWLQHCEIDRGMVHIADEDCVVVAVRDQGVGMSPEVQAKVFDRYYRANTATATSGLGLGMYLSREIVVRHGGRIWLESAPGQGTTFYVLLPISPAGAL
jgi:two-component system, OmpR family, phosphate regulon sensor histidine kinase PhoR